MFSQTFQDDHVLNPSLPKHTTNNFTMNRDHEPARHQHQKGRRRKRGSFSPDQSKNINNTLEHYFRTTDQDVETEKQSRHEHEAEETTAPSSRQRQLNPEMFFSYQRYSPQTRQKVSKYPKVPLPRFIPGRYVRATHRLYIRPSVDVVELLKHPDRFVEWDNVVKVDILCHETSELLTCPICLDSIFTAPRITLCGHVFCFPCIMRTLNEKYKETLCQPKCPVCGEPIRVGHLKPARFQILQKPKIGDSVSFYLINRESLSSITLLNGVVLVEEKKEPTEQMTETAEVDGTRAAETSSMQESGSIVPPFLISSCPFSYFYRLVSLDPRDPFLEEDLCSLESKRFETLSLEDSDGLACIDDCIASLLVEVELLQTFSGSSSSHRSRQPSDTLMTPGECHSLFNFSPIDPHAIMREIEAENYKPTPTQILSNDHSNEGMSEMICFYQMIDGQLVVLDDLCMACLIQDAKNRRLQHGVELNGFSHPEATGTNVTVSSVRQIDHSAISTEFSGPISFEDAHELRPLLRDVKIRWLQEESVDSAFRKRHPYLNYLPSSTSVSFVEIDMNGIVSAEVLQEFAPYFNKRKAKRNAEKRRKAKQEDQQAARIEAIQSAQFQQRLLQHHQRGVDPATGLLLQTITTDQSLFPPLEHSGPCLSGPCETLTTEKSQWAERLTQQHPELFPSLQEAISSPHLQREIPSRQSSRPSCGQRTAGSSQFSTNSHQISDRGAHPWRRHSNDQFLQDRERECLVPNRVHNSPLYPNTKCNSFDTESKNATLKTPKTPKPKKKTVKKILFSSTSSFRL